MSLQTGMTPNYRTRKATDLFMRGLTIAATGLAIIPLILIIGFVVVIGGGALNLAFFTQTYQPPVPIGAEAAPVLILPTADPNAPVDPNATADPFAGLDLGALAGGQAAATPGEPGTVDPNAEKQEALQVEAQGGVLHGIIGTVLVTSVGLLIALPIGLLAGIFLSETVDTPFSTFVRFCVDVLSGAPSIVIGVVAYIVIVQPTRQFSGLAGSVALAILMVPTITRTTEEILKLVPNTTREAALAMGAPAWYSTFTVVVPTALAGIVTGVMLAFARGAGETAPLLLTIAGNNNLSANLLAPIAALPILTYRYTESPFPAEVQQAWGTAFVLMVTVLVINILVRLATRNRLKGR